jgi:predicted permease
VSWASRLTSLYRRWRHGRQVEEDLDGEVDAYFETVVERYKAEGLSPQEAQRAARLRFEDPERVKQKVREVRMGAAIETLLQDVRYAVRVLRKSPGFTVVAVLTLALGIGANTSIFSLINAVMLRLLPVGHPEQLVLLTDPESAFVAMDTTEHGVRELLAYREFQDLRAHNNVFSGLLAAQSTVSEVDVLPVAGNGEALLKAHAQLVSGEYFDVLGIQPVLGRTFTPEEDRAPGANPVAVVSYDFWQTRLGGRADILGGRVRVGRAVFQVLGVAPPGFRGISVGSATDIWFPITMQEQVLPGRNYLVPRDTLWLQVMGRLAPGISARTAQAGINVALQQSLQAAAGLASEKERREVFNQKIELRPGARGASALRGQFSDPLVLLMAMVGVVLLIACANIANLMLARASGRQREIGVRLALGAERGRVIRQLLTESLLVAALGGILGILLAAVGTRLLLALVSTGAGNLGLDVPRDFRVLLFTAATAVATGILFGLAPAIRATHLDVNRTLATNVRGSMGGRGRLQTGRILAVAQIALSLVLLMGAGWFVRSLHNLTTQNLGYQRDHLLAVRVDPVAAGYQSAGLIAWYEKVRQGLRAVPGVRSVTLSNNGLFSGDSGDHLSIEGSPIRDAERLESQWTEVGPDYFSTLGIPLLQGREITVDDAMRGLQVCVINESFARIFFPGSSPIGKHVTDEYPTTRETYEIVGVVADVREHRPSEKRSPRFYANVTHPIGSLGAVTFLLRSAGDPAGLGSAVTRSIRQIDRDLPILSIRSVEEELDRRLAGQRLVAELAAFFGVVALLMAAIGLYGVLSYSMARRAGEIGVRMALGASAANVMRMVLAETMGMVAIGVAIGLPCALAMGRWIASRLYGLTPADPAAMVLATSIIVAAAVLAGYLPARRASRIDPVISLRCE